MWTCLFGIRREGGEVSSREDDHVEAVEWLEKSVCAERACWSGAMQNGV